MNKAQCLRLSAAVVRAAGYRTFAALHDVVISKGFHGQTAHGPVAFAHVQACFHLAQSLRWAAEGQGSERLQWVRSAHKRAFCMWLSGMGA